MSSNQWEFICHLHLQPNISSLRWYLWMLTEKTEPTHILCLTGHKRKKRISKITLLCSNPGWSTEEFLHCGNLAGLLIGFLLFKLGKCEGLGPLAALTAGKGLFFLPLQTLCQFPILLNLILPGFVVLLPPALGAETLPSRVAVVTTSFLAQEFWLIHMNSSAFRLKAHLPPARLRLHRRQVSRSPRVARGGGRYLSTTRPHAGPPSRSPAPSAANARHARTHVTSGASALAGFRPGWRWRGFLQPQSLKARERRRLRPWSWGADLERSGAGGKAGVSLSFSRSRRRTMRPLWHGPSHS